MTFKIVMIKSMSTQHNGENALVSLIHASQANFWVTYFFNKNLKKKFETFKVNLYIVHAGQRNELTLIVSPSALHIYLPFVSSPVSLTIGNHVLNFPPQDTAWLLTKL